MPVLAVIVLALLAVLHPTQALAREEITAFDARIDVRVDGALDVVETIAVRAEGQQIRRGIYRDIPLRALDDWGLWTSDGFTILTVRHNGRESPYHTEWIGRFLRIYIGDADVLVPSGEHVYTIAYRITGQLRPFDDHDEVYWNVTGNFWSFPIVEATAAVNLPDGAVALQVDGYTGRFGATGKAFRISGEGTSSVHFTTTQPLGVREGLTIAVGFTRGVAAVTGAGVFYALRDNTGALLFGVGWAFVLAYFLVIWWRIGRDPPGETVIPLFHPPENLSPAAMSYVHFRSFRRIGHGVDMAFIAALLSLGVKKRLVIEENEKRKVTLVKEEGNAKPLSSGERALFSTLFSGRDQVPLDKRYGKTLVTARSKLHGAITREYEGKFFRRNIGWFAPGAVVAVAVTVLGAILQKPPEEGMTAVLPVVIASIGGWFALMAGWHRLSSPVPSLSGRFFGAVFMMSGFVLLLVALSAAVLATDLPAYRFAAILLFAGVAVIVSMFHLLAAPTLNGAKVLSRIEGFRLYLETAEANRLNMRDAPKMSEELYENFLPYAAGLGVEEPWSEAYSAHLARTVPDREREYRPAWYQGRSWTRGSLAEATSASMAAVSAAMAASIPQPKSSSGSFGGGFSGGGGGGGGGGGW